LLRFPGIEFSELGMSFISFVFFWSGKLMAPIAQLLIGINRQKTIAPMKDLWIAGEHKPFWDLIPDLSERFSESKARIIELLGYIDQVVPDAYAQAPNPENRSKKCQSLSPRLLWTFIDWHDTLN
jgi:hypothetical protein